MPQLILNNYGERNNEIIFIFFLLNNGYCFHSKNFERAIYLKSKKNTIIYYMVTTTYWSTTSNNL